MKPCAKEHTKINWNSKARLPCLDLAGRGLKMQYIHEFAAGQSGKHLIDGGPGKSYVAWSVRDAPGMAFGSARAAAPSKGAGEDAR
jgi:hypothetical protein